MLVLAGSGATTQAAGLAREKTAEIRIVVDLTSEGRKWPVPSRERPVIYLPVTAKDLPVGNDAPARESVHRWLAESLAQQGYLPVNPQQDRPSQLLVFQWGGLDPQIEEFDAQYDENSVVTGQKFWNERDLLDLLAGESAGRPMASWQREKLRNEATASRYFVRLLAYDYEAAKKKQSKLLWHARVSTHADGLALAEILPQLIKAGGPHFGRATTRPVMIRVPVAKQGSVELGDATVKEYLPATSETPAANEADKGD